MGHIREAIISFITTRPISTILEKASHDFLFSSFYILLIGFTIIGIINLTLKMKGSSRKKIAASNIVLIAALLLVTAAANGLFWVLRGY